IFALGLSAALSTPAPGTDPYFVLPHAQRAAFLILLALAALGAALRRKSLWAACLLVLLAAFGGLLAWNDWYGNLLPEVALLYTVSERRGRWASLVALVVSFVLPVVAQHQRTVQAGYTDLSNLPPFIEGVYPYLVLVWFAGRAQGRRRALAAELDRGVAQLREERERLARAAVAAERSRIARDLHALVVRGVER